MILFWKVFLQFAAVAVLIVVSVMDYVKIHKGTKNYKRIRIGLFVLIFLSLALNIFVVIGDEKSKNEEVVELNHQISLLQKKGDLSNNLLTGGDSYCYYILSNFEDDIAIASIISKGDYPLYDVKMLIVNMQVFEKQIKKKTIKSEESFYPMGMILEVGAAFDLGNLPPNKAGILDKVKLPRADDIKYLIRISTRNGTFLEQMRLVKINGLWKRALRVKKEVFTNENPNLPPLLLHQDTDSDFPIKENEQIWQY